MPFTRIHKSVIDWACFLELEQEMEIISKMSDNERKKKWDFTEFLTNVLKRAKNMQGWKGIVESMSDVALIKEMYAYIYDKGLWNIYDEMYAEVKRVIDLQNKKETSSFVMNHFIKYLLEKAQ